MELWTLGELAERVEAALADYPGQVNGRVRAVPDQRAIRWYTTTGLIDRPAEMRGRTALYSRRHLLQLVAIKRRQAQGRTLAEIQSELTGATNETLQPIAALPNATPSNPDAGTPSNPDVVTPGNPDSGTPGGLFDGNPVEPRQSSRPRFWADHPQRPGTADATPGQEQTADSQPATAPAEAMESLVATASVAAVVAAVRLTDGVTVVLDHPGVIADPARLAAAAAPLLAELTRQGLLSRSSGDET